MVILRGVYAVRWSTANYLRLHPSRRAISVVAPTQATSVPHSFKRMAPVLAPCNLSRWLSEIVAQTQAVVVAAIKTHIVTKVVTATADVAGFFSLLLVDIQRGGQRALAVDDVEVPFGLATIIVLQDAPAGCRQTAEIRRGTAELVAVARSAE